MPITNPPPGGAQIASVESYDGRIVVTSGVLTQNASILALVRVAAPVPVTTAKWYVTVQNGNVNVGVFDFDGTNYNPIVSTGSTAAGAANAVQSAALSAATTLVPFKDYWLAMATDSATFACLRTAIPATAIALLGNRSILKTANFALASFTSPAGSSQVPWIRLE